MTDFFKVFTVDLESGKSRIDLIDERSRVAGGSGLAALLFSRYGHNDLAWNHPSQPLILAVGPLTGYFPLMSKTVLAFRSPYHDQYTESHGGGRSALSLFFAGYDALVVTGRANELSCLSIGSRHLLIKDVSFMKGYGTAMTGKLIRRMFPKSSGHRSTLQIYGGTEMVVLPHHIG